ncbi:hypothetical protein [Pseudarthrobacter siccitolerans]
MNESVIEGWPTTTGPLRALTDLGNIHDGSTPEWVQEPTRSTTGPGTTYKCRTRRGLGPKAILDLAALTVEGFHVYINPRGRYARISIFHTEGHHA